MENLYLKFEHILFIDSTTLPKLTIAIIQVVTGQCPICHLFVKGSQSMIATGIH
jgi:hypothetical protein